MKKINSENSKLKEIILEEFRDELCIRIKEFDKDNQLGISGRLEVKEIVNDLLEEILEEILED